ncbi:hypothetical protein NHJ6243_004583 [Beauveria neobassiana]
MGKHKHKDPSSSTSLVPSRRRNQVFPEPPASDDDAASRSVESKDWLPSIFMPQVLDWVTASEVHHALGVH